VSKPARNPELAKIVIAEFDRNMSAKCRATKANIDCDIDHPPAQNANKLSLRKRVLKVETPKNSSC